MYGMKPALFLCLCGLTAACATTHKQALDPVSLQALPICYNANCTSRDTITVADADWREVTALFDPPPANAHAERLALRRAIAKLETIAGRLTPTHNDLARNSNPQGDNGRMDCVDESTNTSSYLLLLETYGYLRWHRVASRAFRSHFLLDQHYTARIEERDTARLFAVDSWHRDNGEPPIIQEYGAWLLKRDYSLEENPD